MITCFQTILGHYLHSKQRESHQPKTAAMISVSPAIKPYFKTLRAVVFLEEVVGLVFFCFLVIFFLIVITA